MTWFQLRTRSILILLTTPAVVLALSGALGSAPAVASNGAPAAPAIGAPAAVLMDARTGRVLYARSPHLRWPPASTTKILTALLVDEALSDDTVVAISARAAAERSGTAIGLEAGEVWAVRDLLPALLIHSANDAAVALAEAVAGSVEEFATQMNARARALGVQNSHFVTPHGRFHPQHYSTAYDLALIARAALRSKRIAGIVAKQTWELQRPGQPPRMLINTNKLLWRYPGADGVKTGWIAESGPSLMASATRDGWQLIAVVLNAPQMETDAAALLNYGFGAFAPLRVAAEAQVMATVRVPNGARALTAAVPDEVIAVVRRGAVVASRVMITKQAAPIRQGEVVGKVVFTSEGSEVTQSPLIAADAVPVRSLWVRLAQWVQRMLRREP